jgi:tRNA/rRNA methyltransferase
LNITFILVNPAVPANVGAAARALKTMGFNELRLVNPCDFLCLEARMLAHASGEILVNASVFSSLSDAVKDIDFVIGATARKRSKRVEYVRSNLLAQLISEKGKTIKSIAIVFGSEESGLSNEDASLCDVLTTISMAGKYPSLNLAQAVMVYAYELSVLKGRKLKFAPEKHDIEGWNALKLKVETFLDEIGITSGNRNLIMERFAMLGEKDVYLLQKIVAQINKKLK